MQYPERAPSLSDRLTLLTAAAGLVAGLLTAAAAHADPGLWAAGSNPPSALATAEALLAEGEDGRAVYFLRRHLDSAHDDVRARALLAGACARLGLRRAALRELHLVLAAHPDDEAALRALAVVQNAAGEFAGVVETIARLRGAGAKGTDLDALLGRALLQLGRHAEAEQPLRIAVDGNPDDPELVAALALVELRLGGRERIAGARDALLHATTLRPEAASLHNSLGFAEESLGRPEEAWAAYLEAEQRAPGNPGYRANRIRMEANLRSR